MFALGEGLRSNGAGRGPGRLRPPGGGRLRLPAPDCSHILQQAQASTA